MAARVIRLSRLFTPEYALRINAQMVHPAKAVVVKPNELESALSRPVNVSIYEPDRTTLYLAASLSYGIIKGHPFMDGNKRTAFFLANEYLRTMGIPGLVNGDEPIADIAHRYMDVAAGKLEVEALSTGGR